MGFFEDAGAPGVAAFGEGVARGLQRAREIQQWNMSRELALREMDLRNDQHTMALDVMAHNQEQDRIRNDHDRLRLGLSERRVSQQEREFDYLQKSERDRMELEAKRSKVMVQVQRIFDDDEVSELEYAELMKSAHLLEPRVMAAVFGEARNIRRRLEAKKSEERRQYIDRARSWLIEHSKDKKATELQLLTAQQQANAAGDDELFNAFVERKHMEVIDWNSRKEARLEFVAKKKSDLYQSPHLSEMTTGDRQEAGVLLNRMAELAKSNPDDPQIDKMQDQVRVLMMDKESREERSMLMAKAAQADERRAAEEALLNPELRQRFRAFDAFHLSELAAAGSNELANADAARQTLYMKRMAASGAPIPEKSLPITEALPEQMKFAFESLTRANVFLPEMDPIVREAHMRGLFERAGIKYSPEAVAAWRQWLGGDKAFVDREVDELEIAKWAMKHGKKQKKGAVLKAAKKRQRELIKVNEKLKENGLPEIPLRQEYREALEADWQRQIREDPSLPAKIKHGQKSREVEKLWEELGIL